MHQRNRVSHWRWAVWVCLFVLADAAQARSPFVGAVWLISGEARVSNPATPQRELRTLRLGDRLLENDTVRTGPDSEVVLRLLDGGYMALRPDAEVQLKAVQLGTEREPAFWVDLARGGLRLLSGQIGQTRPQAYRINTPTATVGIRGTDHEPYVIQPVNHTHENLPGTYDKVNSGVTVLTVQQRQLAIAPGQVGFARDLSGLNLSPKALLSLLMPVILKEIPAFYQPGPFDPELNRWSREASPQPWSPDRCEPGWVARTWLSELDRTLSEKNAAWLPRLFTPDATVRVATLDAQGAAQPAFELGAEAFFREAAESLRGLTVRQHTRLSVNASDPNPAQPCTSVNVSSTVSEAGTSFGRRFEATTVEMFQLKLDMGGNWRAQRAELQLRP
jgi:hypothetical protein